MFSTDKKVMRSAIALVAAAALGGTALAETLVVRAGGPSARAYPAGKVLAPNSVIELKKGDILTILDSRGTRTLRGEGMFRAEAGGGTQTNASFASLVSTKNRKRARTGAVRDDGKAARAPSLWYVDVSKDATMCLASGAPTALWRANMQDAVTIMLTNEASGQAAPVSFAAGSNEAKWPTAMPTDEGARYSLSWAGQVQPVKIRFTTLAANLDDPAATAVALMGKGCAQQFETLVGTLEDSAVESASL